MIDETRIVRNIKAVIKRIKKSKSWEIECIRTKDVVLMLETILNTIAESKVEQPTIQPQGIDKKRLIEELEEQYKNFIPEDDWDYCKIRQIKADIKVVNRQPTSDGWIPVSDAVDIGYLHDWYIASVMDDEPVWTEKHLEELFNDFILIPKPLPPAYKESENNG